MWAGYQSSSFREFQLVPVSLERGLAWFHPLGPPAFFSRLDGSAEGVIVQWAPRGQALSAGEEQLPSQLGSWDSWEETSMEPATSSPPPPAWETWVPSWTGCRHHSRAGAGPWRWSARGHVAAPTAAPWRTLLPLVSCPGPACCWPVWDALCLQGRAFLQNLPLPLLGAWLLLSGGHWLWCPPSILSILTELLLKFQQGSWAGPAFPRPAVYPKGIIKESGRG